MKYNRDSALHEAGHAVVGRALGWVIRRAEVREDRSGVVAFVPVQQEHPPSEQLVVDVAGALAVAMLSTEAAFPYLYETMDGDRIDVHRCQRQLGPDVDADDVLRAACERAVSILSQRWYAVERVAKALRERGKVSGDEVNRLASGARSLQPSGKRRWNRTRKRREIILIDSALALVATTKQRRRRRHKELTHG